MSRASVISRAGGWVALVVLVVVLGARLVEAHHEPGDILQISGDDVDEVSTPNAIAHARSATTTVHVFRGYGMSRKDLTRIRARKGTVRARPIGATAVEEVDTGRHR